MVAFFFSQLYNMENNSNIDFIGDIHGFATHLKALLKKLGYEKKNGSYHHPERKVCFLGDYIDRGAEIPEVLHIVKSMTDNGDAISLMGNHEYNFICYNMKNKSGDYIRTHSPKNNKQNIFHLTDVFIKLM